MITEPPGYQGHPFTGCTTAFGFVIQPDTEARLSPHKAGMKSHPNFIARMIPASERAPLQKVTFTCMHNSTKVYDIKSQFRSKSALGEFLEFIAVTHFNPADGRDTTRQTCRLKQIKA